MMMTELCAVMDVTIDTLPTRDMKHRILAHTKTWHIRTSC